MKISVLLTAYNIEGYIDTSINSVISQKMPCDWELLIGDDGSTDETISIINAWVKRYPNNIVLFQWSKNEAHTMNGFRAAANRANLLERATGDYIIFLDGDGSWEGTNKLERQFNLLERDDYSDCCCCGHNIYRYNISDENGYNMVDSKIKMRTFTKEEYYRSGMYIHTNTILFRSFCKNLMLSPLCRDYLNDIFVTFCMLQNGKMLYLPESYAKYNITGTGLWTGGSKVYSRFRNMHLYDLERHIDPSLEPYLFQGLCTNMEVILKEYTDKDVETIAPLVEGLNPDIFRYTLALYKLQDLSPEEEAFKKSLKKRIINTKIKYKITRILDSLRLSKH